MYVTLAYCANFASGLRQLRIETEADCALSLFKCYALPCFQASSQWFISSVFYSSEGSTSILSKFNLVSLSPATAALKSLHLLIHEYTRLCKANRA
jgi:hypothetical protein